MSQQRRAPLLPVLAVVELLTAVFGLMSLPLFESVGDAVLGLPLPVTAAVMLLLVFFPTLLMGATLPLLVGHLTPCLENTGRSVGVL